MTNYHWFHQKSLLHTYVYMYIYIYIYTVYGYPHTQTLIKTWSYVELHGDFRLLPAKPHEFPLDGARLHVHFMFISISCVYFMAMSGADSSELLTIFLRPIAGGTSKQNMAAHGTVPLL